MSQLPPYPRFFPAKIDRIFVFNPRFGPREDEDHLKILYYHPPTTPLNAQLADIGLAEALANVTRTFTDLPVETMRTLKCRWIFLNPEPGYWMGMVVRNARVIRKEGGEMEYVEEELNDLSLSAMVKKAYTTYKLFNGEFESVLTAGQTVDRLREIMKEGFARIVQFLTAEDADIFTALDGIQFLPVNKNVYLQVQSLINSTENAFEQIRHSAFIYKDHLVWSGLEQDEMRIMYKYISDGKRVGRISNKQGFLIGGPEDVTSKDAAITPIKVYLGSENTPSHLILFHYMDIFCLYLVDPSLMKPAFYQLLHNFILPQVQFVQPIIAQHYSAKQGAEDKYRYIYFNQMNLALKTSLKNRRLDLTRDILIIVTQMHTDFERAQENVTEVMIRTHNDIWVVGKRSDQREFYVVFDQESSNLLEVNEEVKKLSSLYFNNIFID